MIRCLAVDDEVYASKIIANYIKKTAFLEFVGATNKPLEAIELVQAGKVDLVFLDIHMQEISGIQFLKICGHQCKVILTTAYPQYALEGFELDVIDYLLKPISYERFFKAAVKALHGLMNDAGVKNDFIFVKGDAKNKFIKAKYDDILYIEGLKNYISIYTATERMVTYQSLRAIEKLLPTPPFYRIHKSYIISIKNINKIDGGNVWLGNKNFPIGETYKEHFFKVLKDDYLK